jgi:hypothetical protein
MMKITFVMAAATVLATSLLATSAQAACRTTTTRVDEGGRTFWRQSRTCEVPVRETCRTITQKIETDDGRTITRQMRSCG